MFHIADHIRLYSSFCRFVTCKNVNVSYNNRWWQGLVSSILHGLKKGGAW